MPTHRLVLPAACAVALALAGCSASSTPHAVKPTTTTTAAGPGSSVAAWYAGGGNTLVTKLSDDLTAISQDGQAADTLSMQAHCDTLVEDVGAAQNYPPIPDTQAQDHWSAALGHLSDGGGDCSLGARASDTALIGKSSGEVRQAGSEMRQATARVNTVMAARS